MLFGQFTQGALLLAIGFGSWHNMSAAWPCYGGDLDGARDIHLSVRSMLAVPNIHEVIGNEIFRAMIPDFDSFQQDVKIIKPSAVDAIHSFELSVEFPSAYRLDLQGGKRNSLMARLYRSVAEVLESAQLYDINNLSTVWVGDALRAAYDEPSYGFRVEVGEHLAVRMARSGSSLRLFHEWYRTIMPFTLGLISRISLDASELAGLDFDPQPLRASYSFNILAYDFIQTRGKPPVSSQNILSRLLPVRPGSDGRLRSLPAEEVAAGLVRPGRADIAMTSLREIKADVIVNEIYSVQAPGSQGYRGIKFRFACVAEALDRGESGTAKLKTFPPAGYLLEHPEIAYVDFFRDRALKGFMHDLLGNWSFSCTTDSMP